MVVENLAYFMYFVRIDTYNTDRTFMRVTKMKPEIKHRIVEAAEQLVAKGIASPTNDQVRQHLGGGSLSHISPVMREWRESRAADQEATQDLPAGLKPMLERVGLELWRSTQRMAEQEVDSIRAEADNKVSDAFEERDEAVKEIERMKLRLESAREETAKAEARILDLADENQELATKAATSMQRAEYAEQRASELSTQLNRQNDQLEAARSQVQEVQSAVDQLREDKASIGNQLTTVVGDLKSTTRELEAARLRESRLQQTLEEVNQELSSLQQEHASLRSEQAATAKRNDELKEESASLRSTIDQLRASASEANAELKAAREQIVELKAVRQELADTRTELAVTQARENELRGQIDHPPKPSQSKRGGKS